MEEKQIIEELLKQAIILQLGHVNNIGDLEYSEKQYGYLSDEIEMVEIGYLKQEPESDYSIELFTKKFTLNFDEAKTILSTRIYRINLELN
ncbi:MAG: hypothetical protein KA278_00275 [Flavobacterium sp.]|nr:hypothetical protein [Flavobacterium sp.]